VLRIPTPGELVDLAWDVIGDTAGHGIGPAAPAATSVPAAPYLEGAGRPQAIVGRVRELALVDAVLAAGTRGLAVLLIEGEPGIGKTAVWREAVRRAEAAGARVLACRPSESEARLAFAGLADLLAGIQEEVLARLPDPQRHALEVALLRVAPTGQVGPDPRAVYTAVVNVLNMVRDSTPVVLAVDDVQWLDAPSAAALASAVRRLEGGPTAVVLTRRIGAEGRRPDLDRAIDAAGAQRVELGPLSVAALQHVLADRLDVSFPRPVLVRIHTAVAGNPFHALQVARVLRDGAQLAPTEALPVPKDVRRLAARQVARLSGRTRRALLAAAALAQPTAAIVGAAALRPAVEAGLVEVTPDDRVAFTHPLYAAAVYGGASPAERRLVHRRLAARAPTLEERARHSALAATRPDELVSAMLVRAAGEAAARGAPEAAAELAILARDLTPPERPVRAVRRAIRAAELLFRAGDPPAARKLLDEALAGSPPDAERAWALRLLGEIRYTERSFPEAVALLTDALRLAGDDPSLRAPISLGLAYCLTNSPGLMAADGAAAAALADAERAATTLLAPALAVSAIVQRTLGNPLDGAKLVRALALEDHNQPLPVELRPTLIVACIMLQESRFADACHHLETLRRRLLDRGQDGDLAYPLCQLAWARCLAGSLAAAEVEAAAALDAAERAYSEPYAALAFATGALVDAHAGRDDRCRRRAAQALARAMACGYPLPSLLALDALGQLDLSRTDPAAAHASLAPLIGWAQANTTGPVDAARLFFLVDAVEALAGTGQVDEAQRVADHYAAAAARVARPATSALAERCRAIVAAARGAPEAALAHVERALSEHERTPVPLERARTLLFRGRLQRRLRTKAAARVSIEEALATFERIGAKQWAAQARADLARVGARASPGKLTETEAAVARLAAAGLTNRAVAARLFISPKTVEANLARVYRKLDIRTRAELGARRAQLAHLAA
jgi:DNA-binding NarL/FixJ family response regulator/tetratricopeptide (TPR) repeat protein